MVENTELRNTNKYHIIKFLGSLGIAMLGIIGTAIIPVIGIPIAMYGAVKMAKHFKGDYVKHSVFGVINTRNSRKNYIVMSIYNPKDLLNTLISKNKSETLNIQLLNLLAQLDKTNSKTGKNIKYNTKTHLVIIHKLLQLQKAGLIDGLPSISELKNSKSHRGNLLVEKMLLGNFTGVKKELKNIPTTLKGKFSLKGQRRLEGLKSPAFSKTQFYNISFTFTDKPFSPNNIAPFFPKGLPSYSSFSLNPDGTINPIKTSASLKLRNTLTTHFQMSLHVKKETVQTPSAPDSKNTPSTHDKFCAKLASCKNEKSSNKRQIPLPYQHIYIPDQSDREK